MLINTVFRVFPLLCAVMLDLYAVFYRQRYLSAPLRRDGGRCIPPLSSFFICDICSPSVRPTAPLHGHVLAGQSLEVRFPRLPLPLYLPIYESSSRAPYTIKAARLLGRREYLYHDDAACPPETRPNRLSLGRAHFPLSCSFFTSCQPQLCSGAPCGRRRIFRGYKLSLQLPSNFTAFPLFAPDPSIKAFRLSFLL